jgi:hypothetical protein
MNVATVAVTAAGRTGRTGRTLMTAAAAAALCLLLLIGCGGGDNGNPADNNTGGNNTGGNNNNGGDANHDGKLINAANEVWLSGGCESGTGGYIFKSNGDALNIRFSSSNGDWRVDDRRMWRTNGDKLITWKEGREEVNYTYEVSNSTLTLIRIWDDGSPETRNTYTKCSGLTIVGL